MSVSPVTPHCPEAPGSSSAERRLWTPLAASAGELHPLQEAIGITQIYKTSETMIISAPHKSTSVLFGSVGKAWCLQLQGCGFHSHGGNVCTDTVSRSEEERLLNDHNIYFKLTRCEYHNCYKDVKTPDKNDLIS